MATSVIDRPGHSYTDKLTICELDHRQQRLYEELCQRGASTWVTTLPLAEHGFLLNRGEFHDAMALRYDFPIEGISPTTTKYGTLPLISYPRPDAPTSQLNLISSLSQERNSNTTHVPTLISKIH
eukprot:sb/3475630/